MCFFLYSPSFLHTNNSYHTLLLHPQPQTHRVPRLLVQVQVCQKSEGTGSAKSAKSEWEGAVGVGTTKSSKSEGGIGDWATRGVRRSQKFRLSIQKESEIDQYTVRKPMMSRVQNHNVAIAIFIAGRVGWVRRGIIWPKWPLGLNPQGVSYSPSNKITNNFFEYFFCYITDSFLSH